MNPKDFNRLLRRLQTKYAFNKLFKYYFPKIAIHICTIFKDKSLGEDVAQEFFINLLKMNFEEYIESPNSWVYTIAENIAKNILAKKENRHIKEPIDNLVLPVYDVYEFENYGEYSEKLKNLNEETHEIIILRVWKGYSFQEIAQIKNLKYGTVRQIYSRGLNKIKKM